MTMRIRVYNIELRGAMAFGAGVDDQKQTVHFTGDARALLAIGEELERTGGPVETTIADWQII
jgi:hypothetical protein